MARTAEQGYEQIKVEKRDAVALITLNRPDRLNAWTYKMSAELADAIEAANDDNSVGAIVVTGEGRGFCAGADISDTFNARLEGQDVEADARGDNEHNPTDWVALVRRSKPMIAAVNGPAVGIGLTLILPFDVIVASEQARLGAAFVKMGLVPELASSHFLVQRMGFGGASEACLSGRLFGAAEAQERGLVDYCVPHEDLLHKAFEIAEGFAANPDPQLRMIKDLLTQNGSATDLREVQKREGDSLAVCYKTPEHKEAVSAFLEKRAPKFR